MRTESQNWVRGTAWLPWVKWFFLVQFVLFLAVIFGILGAFGELSSVSAPLEIAALVIGDAAIVGGLTLGLWAKYTRAVSVDSRGVDFLTGYTIRHVDWANLGQVWPHILGGRILFQFGSPIKYRTYSITDALVDSTQARAILTHPSCPKMNLSPRVLEFLGFQSTRGSSGELIPV